jgi:hypothetical protein
LVAVHLLGVFVCQKVLGFSFQRAFQEDLERGEGEEEKECMSGFGRENTGGGRGPKKKSRRIGANNDFENLRDNGRIKQKMQKVQFPKLRRRVNKIGYNQ